MDNKEKLSLKNCYQDYKKSRNDRSVLIETNLNHNKFRKADSRFEVPRGTQVNINKEVIYQNRDKY